MVKKNPSQLGLLPNGKYRSWKFVSQMAQWAILAMIRNEESTEKILRRFPRVSAGTIAAVRAVRSRRM